MRVVFCGTGAFGAPALEAIVAAGISVPLVVTQPDRPAGRSKEPRPSPIKTCAITLGLTAAQPERIADAEAHAALVCAAPDAIVVVSYGQILKPPVLSLPPLGCLNIHGSLLPRHRGASPIHAALLAGDARTGVTIIRMDAGVDTGPIVAIAEEPVAARDTFTTLHDRLAALGGRMIVPALEGVARGAILPRPQPGEGATRCRILHKEEGRLDWSKSADDLDRAVRALNPWPGTFGTLVRAKGGAVDILILEAEPHPELAAGDAPGVVVAAAGGDFVVATGAGRLAIRAVKPAGRKVLTTAEFLRGYGVSAGDTFERGAP